MEFEFIGFPSLIMFYEPLLNNYSWPWAFFESNQRGFIYLGIFCISRIQTQICCLIREIRDFINQLNVNGLSKILISQKRGLSTLHCWILHICASHFSFFGKFACWSNCLNLNALFSLALFAKEEFLMFTQLDGPRIIISNLTFAIIWRWLQFVYPIFFFFLNVIWSNGGVKKNCMYNIHSILFIC